MSDDTGKMELRISHGDTESAKGRKRIGAAGIAAVPARGESAVVSAHSESVSPGPWKVGRNETVLRAFRRFR